ncbi:MAG: GGDEF domain-containing protein [Actinobacteria bacterium]|nr:GGDEF domain-containing protein [Actinomycetota bacterium]
MQTRIAFIGFNQACSRLAKLLAEGEGSEVVGLLSRGIPSLWPESLDPPAVFTSRRDLFRTAAPDLVLVADEGVGELKGIPAHCQVLDARDGSPLARLLESLPAAGHAAQLSREAIYGFMDICSGVNVIEAYTDPLPKLAQLLDRAMAFCGAALGMVLLPGAAVDELKVVLARGEAAEALVEETLDARTSVCGASFDSGAVIQERLRPEHAEYGHLADTGIGSLIGLPLRAEGRVVGVLALGMEEEELEALKMPVLALVADQAALTVLIARLYSELETNAVRDAASGLFNREYFIHQVKREVSRARRYSLNICLLFFEIDDYEGYVERNGRYLGDLVLKDLGAVVRRNTREVDTAARYGESLFGVLLPETRRLGAMRLAERIRKVVEEYPFPSRVRKEVERLTVCVGVSSYPANADNDTDLVNRALAALAAARAAGPNNVRLYSDDLGAESA